jgi:hypothetical protein
MFHRVTRRKAAIPLQRWAHEPQSLPEYERRLVWRGPIARKRRRGGSRKGMGILL